MRVSRVFRLIFRIFILLLTTSVTLITVFGFMSAISILEPNTEGQGNINVDIDNADFNIDFDFLLGEVSEFNFSIPLNVTNAGYFDLKDLETMVELGMRYEHINLTVPGLNDTVTRKIFEIEHNLGTILQGETKSYILSGDISNFIPENFPDDITDINRYRTPESDIEFMLNITVSLTYTLGLHVLAFGIYNHPIANLSLPSS
ncbi:hypothetical protein LCGC14_0816070 [marine sediment metagenome]|uniref:Uncharacterized protein n=1 Tax=marine sediment metagenome TaxID=412755 RepID=A0A0F9PPX6_9ZZZZ